jgi:conjugal transfer/entry exclusion protein
MKVWSGTSATRPDTLIRKSPDGEDWKQITKELQATQEFVANLVANATVMPNLAEDIKAKEKKLDSLQDAIGKLTAPKDVKICITKFEDELHELRKIYKHASDVLQTVNFLQQQLLSLSRQMGKHADETKRNYAVFENRATNWQRANEERWNKRLEKAEDQIGAISLALGLKTFGD